MVKIVAAKDATSVLITGMGLLIDSWQELAPGLIVGPYNDELDPKVVAPGCETLHEYAAVLSMSELATFAIEVTHPEKGNHLATKAWNALWDFSLLALACQSPCFSLYSQSTSSADRNSFAVANRNLIIRAVGAPYSVRPEQLAWAHERRDDFLNLIADQRFSRSLRYYNNSHYLPDLDARIMLLWAGIEGLFGVEAELSYRLAVYASLLLGGTSDERAKRLSEVRKSYSIRSRVVHGSAPADDKLKECYHSTAVLLAGLLAKCVELKRVPDSAELDRAAVTFDIER